MGTMRPEDRDVELLRALCRSETAEQARRAVERLRGHAWADGESRILFEACARLARRGARIHKENLAAEVTLAGFPDVELDALFASNGPAAGEPRRPGKTP